jgi:hypothetical protein
VTAWQRTTAKQILHCVVSESSHAYIYLYNIIYKYNIIYNIIKHTITYYIYISIDICHIIYYSNAFICGHVTVVILLVQLHSYCHYFLFFKKKKHPKKAKWVIL